MISGLSQVLPAITLSSGLANYAVLPFKQQLVLLDSPLQVLITLALMGLALHGVLYIAWGAGNSYSFLGSVRTVAQLVSYELPLATVLYVASLQVGSYHYLNFCQFNLAWPLLTTLLPLMPVFVISALAETARTPFDLPEAESELVAGFITELSAAPFVLYFLAEYSSLAFLSLVTLIVFTSFSAPALGVSLLVLLAVWVRATLPRLRYDQLIALG
jgi:NADH:ubiquinone oxidoreductase subunit H